MLATTVFLSLALGLAQAGPPPSVPPDSSVRADRAPDLDLNLDLDDARDPSPAPADQPGTRPARAWIYWLAAGTAITAGGAGWYWLSAPSQLARTERNEQVFTDER